MKKFILAPIVAAVALSSCGTEDSKTGTLSLQLTDAAVTNAENVFLSVAGVTIKGPDGQQSFEFIDEFNEPDPQSIDLLSLTGSQSIELVSDWSLPVGEYQWIRLDVNTQDEGDSYVLLEGGGMHDITISSGELKLVSGFTIPANGDVDLTVDVDLYKGLVYSSSTGYKLKPVMRLIDNTQAGHIVGEVDSTVFSEECPTIAVYAYPGADQAAEDVFEETGPDLVAWVDTTVSPYTYELGFLQAGTYTLHLACDPSDDPDVDDDVSFISGQTLNVDVENKATTTPEDFI